MGFFPWVSPILAGLDRKGISERGADWDKQVAQAIVNFGLFYGGGSLLQTNRKLIDYSDLATQAAYVFMYVAGHADFLSQVLTKGQAAWGAGLFRRPKMRITSFGGGPGSDLLAVVRLARSLPPDERPDKIHYRVLDKQPNWHEILQTVAASQLGTIDIEVTFEAVDVTIPAQWQHVDCSADDMLIMNFFVSEVCRLQKAASVRDCLLQALGSLSAGAAVVFNDSSAYTFYTYFDGLPQQVGGYARLLVESGRLDAEPDFDEVFREGMARFGRTPKLGSSAAYRVMRRQ